MSDKPDILLDLLASCAQGALNHPGSDDATSDATKKARSVQSELIYHRVLSTAEAAALLNFSVPHFRRLYRSGGVPAPLQLSTRKLGWRAGDLVDWIAARQNRPLTS